MSATRSFPTHYALEQVFALNTDITDEHWPQSPQHIRGKNGIPLRDAGSLPVAPREPSLLCEGLEREYRDQDLSPPLVSSSLPRRSVTSEGDEAFFGNFDSPISCRAPRTRSRVATIGGSSCPFRRAETCDLWHLLHRPVDAGASLVALRASELAPEFGGFGRESPRC
jgi:hypothetical protein